MKEKIYNGVIGFCVVCAIIGFVVLGIIKDDISEAATICSIFLSIVALIYTYFSGKEIVEMYNKIQDMLKRNTDLLTKIQEGNCYIKDAISASSKALEIIQQDKLSEKEREDVIKNMQKSNNSMLMFLNKMKENS